MSDEQEYPFHLIFIISLIIITVVLIIMRIFFYFYESNHFFNFRRDYDFIILREGMKNGLINFYEPIESSEWPPYYLYFWYFMFYPMYLIPIEIGLYIWDILRLISVVYVFLKAKELFEPIIDEYAGINVLPANGQVTMGTKGDASFFGPDAKMKGGVKRSVYKVPKSTVFAKELPKTGSNKINKKNLFETYGEGKIEDWN